MKRRDFLNSSICTAVASMAGMRAAYAIKPSDAVPDVAAVTGDGREITLRGKDIRDLAAKMRGQLLLAGDTGYDKARLILTRRSTSTPPSLRSPQARQTFRRSWNSRAATVC